MNKRLEKLQSENRALRHAAMSKYGYPSVSEITEEGRVILQQMLSAKRQQMLDEIERTKTQKCLPKPRHEN